MRCVVGATRGFVSEDWARHDLDLARATAAAASARSCVPAARRAARPSSFPRLLATFSLVFATVAAAADTLTPWTGGATPTLAVNDIEGREWRLDDLGGRTVLVNFWATWCAPCVQEMPSLQRLRDRFAARGFEVIGINLEENPARIRPFLARYGLSFPVVRDHDGSVRSRWDVRIYPSSFVVGPDGRIALAAIGEVNWDDPAVIARVQSVIGR